MSRGENRHSIRKQAAGATYCAAGSTKNQLHHAAQVHSVHGGARRADESIIGGVRNHDSAGRTGEAGEKQHASYDTRHSAS